MSASRPDARRICFLVEELGRSGGMAMVRRYASALATRDGCDVELVVTGPSGELPTADTGLPVRRFSDATETDYDVAIATWWPTAYRLEELRARRRVLFVQNLEQRFYRERELADRLGAEGVFSLPVDFLVVSEHICDFLSEVRPDARCLLVRHGIDKTVFTPGPGPREAGPLRVLVEGQPTLWFKGVREALASVRSMATPAVSTAVVHDPAVAEGLDADRIVGGLEPAEMGRLYAEHDVLLKLARFEGFGLPPLEAFHVGVPCVITPFTPHAEYARHGENALVVGFDDPAAAAGALDLLARDRSLLKRLSGGALETAAAWPGVEESTIAFRDAVDVLVREEPPPAAVSQLPRHARLTIELTREVSRQRDVALAHLSHMQRAYEEVSASREECAHRLQELGTALDEVNALYANANRELAEVRASRAYRAAVTLRRIARPGRGR